MIQADNTDTILTVSRSIKAAARNSMNNTKNAALREIFEGSYNILDRHNHRRIGNSVQTMREHTIQNQDSIIDIAIQLPSMIARDIQIRHSED